MNINLVIAENIKRIRKTQKMSIERTAEAAGVSRSMLGQIERGEANPSAALLYKVAVALRVPVEELLRHEPEVEDCLFRGLDSMARRTDGGKVQLHTTFPFDEYGLLEQRRVDVFISGKYELPLEKPGCVGYLLLAGGGSLTVETGGKSYRLEQWDALRFHADRPCRLENNTTSTARVILTYRYIK